MCSLATHIFTLCLSHITISVPISYRGVLICMSYLCYWCDMFLHLFLFRWISFKCGYLCAVLHSFFLVIVHIWFPFKKFIRAWNNSMLICFQFPIFFQLVWHMFSLLLYYMRFINACQAVLTFKRVQLRHPFQFLFRLSHRYWHI